jgi:hypothetical protein
MIEFRTGRWDAYQRDATAGLAEANDRLGRVVSLSALRIKKEWRARWTGHRRLRHLPHSVTADIAHAGAVHTAEIGPDKSLRQGPLGNLIEFGSVHNAPIPGGLPAARAETPIFLREIAKAAEKGVGGR